MGSMGPATICLHPVALSHNRKLPAASLSHQNEGMADSPGGEAADFHPYRVAISSRLLKSGLTELSLIVPLLWHFVAM